MAERAGHNARVSGKRRVTIPAVPFHEVGFEPGDILRVEADGAGRVVLTRIQELVNRYSGFLDSGGTWRDSIDGLPRSGRNLGTISYVIGMLRVMHRDHAVFTDSLEAQQKVTLTFYSQDDGHNLVRTCAPMDFGPTRIAKDNFDRYHFWDYDSDEVRHPLMLLPDQIESIIPLDEPFDPGEFVTWETNWHHPRDWGDYS